MPINIDHTGNLILTSDGLLTFDMNGSIRVPVGTTAQRPGSPASGMIRYNTNLNTFEGYTTSWGPIGGAGGSVAIEDEGSSIVASASIINFVGSGVTATDAGGGEVTVTIPGGSGGASVTTSDTAPVGPLDGDLWFDTDDARLYVYYDDGSSAQWVNVVASPGYPTVEKVGTPVDNQIGVWTGNGTIEGDGNLTWDSTSIYVNQPSGTTRGSIRALGGFYDYGSSGNGGYGGFSAALTTGGAEFEAFGGTAADDAFIEFNARDTTSGNVLVRLFRNTNTSGTSSFTILRGDGTATPSHTFSRASVSLLQSDGGNVTINNPAGATTGVLRTFGGIYDYASSGNGGYAGFQASLSTGGASFRAYSGTSTTNTFADFDAPALTTGNFQVRFFRNTNTTGTTEVLYYLGDGTSTLAHAFRDTNANLAVQAGGKVAIGKAGTPVVSLDILGTDAVQLPSGTTAQRPTPANGMIRYNSELSRLEGYADSNWQTITKPDYSTNKVLNGNFRIAQRGNGPFTTSNSYGLDQWVQVHVTGTQTVTRQLFDLGTGLGQNQPDAYFRSVTASQSGATAVGAFRQRIENVRTYAGQTVTVFGWAKRATAGNIAIELSQNFGTGGSPSATNNGTPQTVSVGTDWTPFAATFTMASVTGKTLGTNGNHHTDLIFWQSAGSDNNARTNSLGVQNTTLELWGIHIVEGAHSVAAIEGYREKDIAEELSDCQRYYETGQLFLQGSHTANQAMGVGASMLVSKRGTLTIGLSVAAQGNLIAGPDVQNQTQNTIGFNATFSSGASSFAFISWWASAEL